MEKLNRSLEWVLSGKEARSAHSRNFFLCVMVIGDTDYDRAFRCFGGCGGGDSYLNS